MYKKNYFYYKKRKYKKIYNKKEIIRKNILDIFLLIIFIFLLNLSIKFIEKNKKLNIENISYFNMTYPNFLYLEKLSNKYKLDFKEFLTYYFIEENFFKYKNFVSEEYVEKEFIKNYKKIKKRNRKLEKPYKYIFDTLFKEIKCFPIDNNKNNSYIYLNNWGKNTKKGINIIDRENSKEKIKVVSMTEGIVNKKMYNKDENFKLEIISNNKISYIYSNLSKFSDNIKVGSIIKTGDIIGYINKKENNKKYLNVKILIKGKNIKGEYFINPYIFLRNVENKDA